jgi:hypothetical protein
MFILKYFEYRSEANRFDSDFVLKKTKKNELSFFLKTKGKKTKGFDSKLSKFCHCYFGGLTPYLTCEVQQKKFEPIDKELKYPKNCQ